MGFGVAKNQPSIIPVVVVVRVAGHVHELASEHGIRDGETRGSSRILDVHLHEIVTHPVKEPRAVLRPARFLSSRDRHLPAFTRWRKRFDVDLIIACLVRRVRYETPVGGYVGKHLGSRGLGRDGFTLSITPKILNHDIRNPIGPRYDRGYSLPIRRNPLRGDKTGRQRIHGPDPFSGSYQQKATRVVLRIVDYGSTVRSPRAERGDAR